VFCVDFIDDPSPIRVPMSHHEGRLKGKGTLGKKSNMHIPNNEVCLTSRFYRIHP
jgi:hypothetical protein